MGERQRPWNEFEAALLLDAFLAVQAGRISRAEAVTQVSRDLRRMAVNQGEEIDEAFRSEKGISAQMHRMSAAYTGRTISEPAPKLYFEITALYRSDRSRFDGILQEARQMAKERNPVEEAFGAYLATRLSPAQLSEIWMCYGEIDDFCRRTGILKQPLFETTDLKTVRKVKETVEQNHAFRGSHRRHHKKYVSAAQQYVRFIREVYVPPKEQSEAKPTSGPAPVSPKTEPVAKKPATVVKEPQPVIAEPAPVAKEPQPVIAEPAPVAPPERDSSALFTVDFDRPNDVIYTAPAELFCFGDVKTGFSNWKELYVTFVGVFCRKYPEKFSPGMRFSADGGRADLTCIDPGTMTEPRFVSGTKYFLETAFIPPQMVPKMGYILDLCGVGRESVKITAWSKRPDAPERGDIPTDQTVLRDFGGEEPASAQAFRREVFQTWMAEEAGIPERTAKSYASTVVRCEAFAKSEGLSSTLLFTDDKAVAKATIAALRANRDFAECNRQRHHLLSAALSKYEQFLEVDIPAAPTETREEPPVPIVKKPEPVAAEPAPITKTPAPAVRTETEQKPAMSRRDEDYVQVLREHFDKGFRLGSSIDDRKFRKRFEAVHQRELADSDPVLEGTVRRLCVVCGDRAFLPEAMLPDPLREKLFRFIDTCFAEGRDTIYYQALYDAFAEDFLDTPVLNADMLKACLFSVGAGRYSLRAKCIAKNAWVQANPTGEIRDVLYAAGAPMKLSEICAALPHLPEKKISSILRSGDEFVRNAPGEYFHESALHLSKEERETICRIIATTIAEKDFISAGELSDAIARKLPEVAENNAVFSDYGFRDALKARLGNRFAFRGNIISAAGRELSAAEVFADYARHRDSFTLDELLLLADQLGCAVPLDAVYENSLRISRDQFVARGLARFPTEETDDAIERFCVGDYVPLRRIGNFGTFPDAGFPWNLFLLEHYAADFSPRFRLVHVGFHRDECLGAVVRRSSGIKTFDALAVDVIARSDVELKPEPVLAFLTEEGYLARRRLQSVESLILQAGARRNGKDAV